MRSREMMFDLRLKCKGLIDNLGHDCKNEVFVKALNHNTKYLELSTADDEVMLDEALFFLKSVWQ